jgi:diketogulonate reductase-like aldo/keto reductase
MYTTLMLRRRIPTSTKETLPVIGLGTWKRFDVGTSDREREPLREVVKRMSAVGGTMIDSSPMYGRAETVIGELTREPGLTEKFFYATKVWTTGEQSGIDQMTASMRNMRRSAMALMQIHNLVDWQTHLKTLRRWKEEGKVRYIGITHYQSAAHAELERIITSNRIDFVQFNYSIRERHAEKRLLSAAHENNVGVIINEPFEKGELFAMVKGKPLPPFAGEYDIQSWSGFFLKYIIAHPAVTCVIPATADVRHASENLQAGEGKLPDEAGKKKMLEYMNML